nr:hypothetical protein [uncultured Lachnoclostridium sp.]
MIFNSEFIIRNNKKYFLAKEIKLSACNKIEKKCYQALELAYFAVKNQTDIYCSSQIEGVFLELAKNVQVNIPVQYKKNTILHVCTELYKSGGHTRCLTRWISDLSEFEHDCVILDQKSELPLDFLNCINKSGSKVFNLTPLKSILKKASKLRIIASAYEYIILHIHMNDPVPIVAFGVNEFKRPVIYFNHADHLFWLGVSICDWCFDLNNVGHDLTVKRRGISRSSILGIPFVENKYIDSHMPKKSDKKILFSSGNKNKFSSYDGKDFFDLVDIILSEEPDVYWIVIGHDLHSYKSNFLTKKFGKRFIIYSELAYSEYLEKLKSAYLVIDSYPVGGGTALLDAVSLNIPFFTLCSFQSDAVVKSFGFCSDFAEFKNKVVMVLNDFSYRNILLENEDFLIKSMYGNEKWKNTCKNILSKLNSHKVYSFKSINNCNVSLAAKITCRWVSGKSLFKSLFEFRFRRKKIIIVFCGKILAFKERLWKFPII